MMLKTLKNKRILSMALATVAGLWIAADANATVNGFYLGGQGGWGNTHQTGIQSTTDEIVFSEIGVFTATSSSSNVKSTGIAGRAFGGYQFNQNVAVELGYTRFHDVTAKSSVSFTDLDTAITGSARANVTFKTQALDLVAKGIIPFQNGFNVYGKLGAAYLRTSGTIDVTYQQTGSPAVTGSASGFAANVYPTFGLGAGYDLTQNVVADLSWNRIQKIGSSDNQSTDLFALGLAYHFA